MCLAHSTIRLSLQCSSLPMLRGSLAVGWEHYPLRPCCCLIINLAQTDPSLAIFSLLGVCWEAFLFPSLCCCFGFLAWRQTKFFKLILKQGMGNWSDLFMWKASGRSLNSSRGFVIWTINAQGVKAKSLCFDPRSKLPNMTKLLTSEKINLNLHELTKEVMLPSN